MVHSHRNVIAAVTTAAALLVATSGAFAQQGEDLRDAAQNPIADLISVPFQNNTNFDVGHTDNTERPQHSAGLSPPPQSDLEPHHPPNPAGDLSTALLGRKGACRRRGDFRFGYW